MPDEKKRLHRPSEPKTPAEPIGEAPKRAWRVSPWALGALAIGFAIVVMTMRGYQDRPPHAEEAHIGWHLAMGHGFRSPMDLSPSAPPSAWSAPLYPLIIGAASRAFGVASPASVTALMLFHAILFGLIVVATERLATRVFGSQTPGLVAAGLLAIHPLFLFYMADFWDSLMSLAIFAWLTVAATRVGDIGRAGRRIGFVSALGLGVGMAILALTNASYAICFPLLLYLAFQQPLSRSRWRSAAIACAACIVVISPWTIRNYREFGRFIPIRTGSGIQFWIGNAPISNGWLDGKAFAVHPFFNAEERAALLSLGEPAYNDLVFERFKTGLAESPLRYVGNSLRRAMYLVIGNPTASSPYPLLANVKWRGVFWDGLLLNAVIAILGVGGMFAARRFGYRQHLLPLMAAIVTAPFVATAVGDRYSLPFRWLLVLYAGAGVWMFFRHRRAGSTGA